MPRQFAKDSTPTRKTRKDGAHDYAGLETDTIMTMADCLATDLAFRSGSDKINGVGIYTMAWWFAEDAALRERFEALTNRIAKDFGLPRG